jgi:hypothetical protein
MNNTAGKHNILLLCDNMYNARDSTTLLNASRT